MNVQLFFPDGRQVIFGKTDSRKYKGVLLPGSEVQQSNTPAAAITIQNLKQRLFNFSYRLFKIFSKIKFSINENSGVRLEALLSGEMHISVNGEKRKFRAGEYRITDVPLFRALFKKDSSCAFFISHYSEELLKQLEIEIDTCPPKRMPDAMVMLINEMLHNPYSEKLRDFYYENCVRELLFFHLTQGNTSAPGQLMDKDIAIIYQADAIIAANLQEHHTISELSRMINTNSLKLKTGFKKVFGMGVFERLLFRRMEYAKLLLESTDKSIGEIASHSGYNTVAGFIHAFRREFGFTPREWRIQEQKEDNEESE